MVALSKYYLGIQAKVLPNNSWRACKHTLFYPVEQKQGVETERVHEIRFGYICVEDLRGTQQHT